MLGSFSAGSTNRLGITRYPNSDIGPKEVLALQRSIGEAPEHGNLPDVRQGVGDGPLEQPVERSLKRSATCHEVIERAQDVEEALDIQVPRLRKRFVPHVLVLGHDEAPIEHIADMSKNLARRAAAVSDAKMGEVVRCTAKRFPSAISERGERVAE